MRGLNPRLGGPVTTFNCMYISEYIAQIRHSEKKQKYASRYEERKTEI